MIGFMGKTTKSKLAAAITRGRTRAGSMKALIEGLGKPPLSRATLEHWEYEIRTPPDYVAAGVIERIEAYLDKA